MIFRKIFPICYAELTFFRFLGIWELDTEELPEEHFAVKGDQGIEITAAAVHGLVQPDEQKDGDKSQPKSPRIEERSGDEQQNPHKLEGVAQLKGGLSEVGHRHEGHI